MKRKIVNNVCIRSNYSRFTLQLPVDIYFGIDKTFIGMLKQYDKIVCRSK